MLWNKVKLRIYIPVIIIAAIISTITVFGLYPIRGTVQPFAPSDKFIELALYFLSPAGLGKMERLSFRWNGTNYLGEIRTMGCHCNNLVHSAPSGNTAGRWHRRRKVQSGLEREPVPANSHFTTERSLCLNRRTLLVFYPEISISDICVS